MILLAFECSTDDRSVAVARDGVVLASATRRGGRSTPLLAMVDEVLRSAGAERRDVGVLALGLGPGSYTGIRGSIAVAQGWSLVREVRLLGVDSSFACAHRARALGHRDRVAIVIDAQRGEFYVATFELRDEGVVPEAALRLARRDEIEALATAGHQLIGPELAALGLTGVSVAPDAAALVEVAHGRAEFIEPERLEPIYLRAVAFVKAPPPRIVPGL